MKQSDLKEQLISSLELLAKNLEYPMYLGALFEDRATRKIIGDFSSKLIAEIHFELIPKIRSTEQDEGK